MFQKPFLNVTLVIHVLWRYLWLVSSSMSRNHTHLHLSFKSYSMLEIRAWKQLLILFLWAGIIIFVPVIGGSVQAQNIFYSIDLSILGCKIQQKCQHSLPFNSIVISSWNSNTGPVYSHCSLQTKLDRTPAGSIISR